MAERKVRWGVLSTAKIATEKVIPAMQQSPLCDVVAIASRDPQRAAEAAATLQIPRAFGSYQELLAAEDVDAIYNPLPNDLHVPWSLRAIESGKHLLCEKPIALSSTEGQQLVDAAHAHPQLKVMEAFMYRHHPQWQKTVELVRSGAIGQLRTIQSFFSYFNTDPNNIRNRATAGGGGLMDIGCYNISLSRLLFADEPQRAFADVQYDPQFATDRLTCGILVFGDGTSTFTCSTQLVPYQRVNVFGTQGRVEIEIPFNAPPDRPCRIWWQSGDAVEEITFAACDQYTIQGELMSQAILDDLPVPTPIDDAVANMRVIEALRDSGQRGHWVELP